MKSEAQLLHLLQLAVRPEPKSRPMNKGCFSWQAFKKNQGLKKGLRVHKKGQNYVLNLTHDHEYDVMA